MLSPTFNSGKTTEIKTGNNGHHKRSTRFENGVQIFKFCGKICTSKYTKAPSRAEKTPKSSLSQSSGWKWCSRERIRSRQKQMIYLLSFPVDTHKAVFHFRNVYFICNKLICSFYHARVSTQIQISGRNAINIIVGLCLLIVVVKHIINPRGRIHKSTLHSQFLATSERYDWIWYEGIPQVCRYLPSRMIKLYFRCCR